MRPFREHPEMVLKEDDIAAVSASWGAKSDGIRSLAETLGLGLDSLTFLDDNPYERAEVRRALPEVDVPVLPDDPTGFRRALEDYPYFEPAAFTDADRDRGRQYRARAQAIELCTATGSLEEYQAGLDMCALFGAHRRGQRRPRGPAHQQDQPVQPDHPPAQSGRARKPSSPGPRRAASGCA